jgi:hypothetical protein
MPGVPVLQDLDHIDHLKRSPCHHTSLISTTSERLQLQGAELGDPHPADQGIP